MHEFADANPHACVHVVLEFEDLPDLRFFDKALQAAAHPNHYLNRAYRPLYGEGEIVSVNFWIVWPDPGDAELRDRISGDYASVANFIWEVVKPDEKSLSETSTPLLFSRSIAEIAGSYEKVFETSA